MKVVKATGLVPVKVVDAAAFDSRVVGDVFGVAPKVAGKLLALGCVALADIPKGVETEDAPDEGADEEPGDKVIRSRGRRRGSPDEGTGEGAGNGGADTANGGAGE